MVNNVNNLGQAANKYFQSKHGSTPFSDDEAGIALKSLAKIHGLTPSQYLHLHATDESDLGQELNADNNT